MYPDGGGLYLQVTGAGAKSWIYRFMLRGKAREMGLGPLSVVSLLEARARAGECRRLRHEGIDPIEAKRAARAEAALDAARALTFKDAAKACVAAHRAGWRNAKHAAQWESTLATYAEPVFGTGSVQAIDTALVMKALEPIWTAKPETASRLRGRIERVLDWAKARGFRNGENPARWRGHLDKLLPPRSKVRAVEHYAALPYDDLPNFVTTVRAQEGIAPRALEFTILTAARTGETIGATWDEINLSGKVWTIPAARMKAGKEHRVPLCNRAVAILMEMKPAGDAGEQFVFPGSRRGKPLSKMTAVLRRMKRGDLTVHGFRSSFRDWASERTNFPREVAEAALAHAISDRVEAAYRRGDLFEKRRRLMDAWAGHCANGKTAGSVVSIAQARS